MFIVQPNDKNIQPEIGPKNIFTDGDRETRDVAILCEEFGMVTKTTTTNNNNNNGKKASDNKKKPARR